MRMAPISFGNFSDGFLQELADYLDGRRVLEIFAGNGLLASRLARLGVPVTATSLLTGHDGHEFGMHHEVLELDALQAVRRFGDDSEVLLMSWPTVTDQATRAALEWRSERPIVFVGEYANGSTGHYGGTATDLFFQVTEERRRFTRYIQRSMLEFSAVLHAKTEYVDYWRSFRSLPPANQAPLSVAGEAGREQ